MKRHSYQAVVRDVHRSLRRIMGIKYREIRKNKSLDLVTGYGGQLRGKRQD